ncbi:type II CRISPR RNA-guided endonuclease Cas9 [Corynebacterium cystitidis]|uniref:type II CRISPR RNA-guided endonuclease Cas9 n=1 Tax=Corynebacterium cystitidis TaxID=35757 RepID=UPI00211ECA09|nr:type II CRISPR RNA-guided endonuclease Cas9 [Corynebacterium cystitidis]
MNYNIGIDVGTHSIGFAAIEVDEHGVPSSILNAVSLIHDSGIDPDSNKSAVTRLAVSGVARRTRRLYRRRKKRTIRLQNFLSSLGWPVNEFEEYSDPYFPWKARAELATDFIADKSEREEKLSIAFRHIANHRGWRNPYNKVSSLYSPGEASDNFEEIRAQLSKKIGISIPADLTVGQLISFATLGEHRLRGGGKQKDKDNPHAKQAILSARLHQRDLAREVNQICRTQSIDDDLRKKIIDHIFEAESPKGAQAKRGRVGKDPLQPAEDRALKATDAFQKYRIAALIGNLRIRTGETKTELDVNQRRLVFDYLVNVKASYTPTWVDVAEVLGIDRGQLVGTASMTDDGERAGARPPVHDTNRLMSSLSVKPLRDWWNNAQSDERAAMIKSLSNGEVDDWDSQAGAAVQAFLATLSEEDQEKLDNVHLPIGRAAYSEDTLNRLTNRMLEDGVDLYSARRAEFNVPADWVPPAPKIGEQVGNPAVDRVLKGVARWIEAAQREWGAPKRIVIEHVRSGFMSEASARQLERENERRFQRNREQMEAMQQKLGIEGPVRREDVWRFQSVQRQNCCCAYCGKTITYDTADMDHIVPQAGPGSSNIRENLLAVCRSCNQSKRNIPFATWAAKTNIPGVSLDSALERTRHWNEDNGLSSKDFKRFVAAVQTRLKRTSKDEPIDNRSLESVAWMANELRARIAQHFSGSDTKINVYRGELTHEARLASGISGNLRFIDGTGKTRLDKRHHAVDAAVISMTTPYVAETLALRRNKKRAQRLAKEDCQWKEFTGVDAAHQIEWRKWQTKMSRLGLLLQKALENDEIVVMSHKRLRPGNGRAHEDTISKLDKLRVGDALSPDQIDRSATEALWCALTRHPDFDEKDGLPEDPNRRIRIHGTQLDAHDDIEFFPGEDGAIKVRGGYAKLSRFHHARVYRVPAGKKVAYSILRVYDHDLIKHRDKDVFSVELSPQTVSMRQAEKKLRIALREGTAEYLGWIIEGDELVVDTSSFDTKQMKALVDQYGAISRWRLDGFPHHTKLRLRPLYLSAEGLPKDINADVKKIVDRPGWRAAVNKVFQSGQVQVIRRNSLGQPRWTSESHLPISWKQEV